MTEFIIYASLLTLGFACLLIYIVLGEMIEDINDLQEQIDSLKDSFGDGNE